MHGRLLGRGPITLSATELDHVLFAVTDLEAASRAIEARIGLSSIEGGRHAGLGTANRIVPLGDSYVELVTVADEADARRNAFGSWLRARRPSSWSRWGGPSAQASSTKSPNDST
jgi:Glyoxalase-like domain